MRSSLSLRYLIIVVVCCVAASVLCLFSSLAFLPLFRSYLPHSVSIHRLSRSIYIVTYPLDSDILYSPSICHTASVSLPTFLTFYSNSSPSYTPHVIDTPHIIGTTHLEWTVNAYPYPSLPLLRWRDGVSASNLCVRFT
jgi:hypothetical protein